GGEREAGGCQVTDHVGVSVAEEPEEVPGALADHVCHSGGHGGGVSGGPSGCHVSAPWRVRNSSRVRSLWARAACSTSAAGAPELIRCNRLSCSAIETAGR